MTITLNDIVRDLIPNLIMEAKDHDKSQKLTLSGEQTEALRDALCEAIVNPEAMQTYLRYMDQMKVRGILEDEPMNADLQEQVVEDGLQVLTPQELAVLALCPLQLLDLRDHLLDEEDIPKAWWEIYKKHDPLAQALADAFAETMREVDEEMEQKDLPSPQLEVAGAYFGEAVPESTSSVVESRFWTVTKSLAMVVVKWHDQIDLSFCEKASATEWTVSFDLSLEGDAVQLSVGSNSPLAISSKVQVQTELRSMEVANTETISKGRMEDARIKFRMTVAEWNKADQLWLLYHHPQRCKVEVRVPLDKRESLQTGTTVPD